MIGPRVRGGGLRANSWSSRGREIARRERAAPHAGFHWRPRIMFHHDFFLLVPSGSSACWTASPAVRDMTSESIAELYISPTTEFFDGGYGAVGVDFLRATSRGASIVTIPRFLLAERDYSRRICAGRSGIGAAASELVSTRSQTSAKSIQPDATAPRPHPGQTPDHAAGGQDFPREARSISTGPTRIRTSAAEIRTSEVHADAEIRWMNALASVTAQRISLRRGSCLTVLRGDARFTKAHLAWPMNAHSHDVDHFRVLPRSTVSNVPVLLLHTQPDDRGGRRLRSKIAASLRACPNAFTAELVA
jgi:hypothetical protein